MRFQSSSHDYRFLLETAAGKQWKQLELKHHHGINLPLFSLHSKESCGIGEYPDLIPLITWCREVGLDVIQLLPLNDTGPDTSPYSAISANALNPINLGLSKLPYLSKSPEWQKKLQSLRKLNKTQRIPFNEVYQKRESFLHHYFDEFGSEWKHSQDFIKFQESNSWLAPYALFKTIKKAREWQPINFWPQELKHLSQAKYEELLEKHQKEILYHSLFQYLCTLQLQEVKKIAEQNHVLIKGDIPILINRESADIWHHPHLFMTHLTAGAPPDMYATEGQVWGFPIYDWEAVKQDDYRFWKERLTFAEGFYHLYRLDHIVGFFRIWSIPEGHSGKDGHFTPSDKSTWIAHGKEIMLMMLDHSNMLPIGEDLGVVPPAVRNCLTSLGICGTKVMRWERAWEEDKQFIKVEKYSPVSMTTVSTHDSEPLALWWIAHPNESQEFADYKNWDWNPKIAHEQNLSILKESHHSGSLFHINLLQEYLSLIPELSWGNPEEDRINIPGTLSDFNWTYRYKPSLEQLVEHKGLRHLFQEILKEK